MRISGDVGWNLVGWIFCLNNIQQMVKSNYIINILNHTHTHIYMYIVYICKYFFLNQIQEHFFGMSKQFSWLNQDWCRFTHLILSHFSLIISTFVSPCCLTHPIFFKQQVAGLNMFSNLNPFFFSRGLWSSSSLPTHTRRWKAESKGSFLFFHQRYRWFSYENRGYLPTSG